MTKVLLGAAAVVAGQGSGPESSLDGLGEQSPGPRLRFAATHIN